MWEIFQFNLGVFHKLPVFIFKTSLRNVKPLIGMETDFCNNVIIGVMAKPRNSISATEMITPAVCPDCTSFCGKAPNIGIPPVPLALGYEI